ncbi:unnamed protein product [Closterium sp. NIES-64]|nr:unnamed protein product [Closterium sp. NIES-64]
MASKEADARLAYMTKRESEIRLPRATRVKNKTPAPVQITAEQILREARERQEVETAAPKQKITDAQELGEYRLRKRKEFEDLIRRVRWNTSVWVKYATWEMSQKDFARARSVWERALEVDYRNVSIWLKYADMEMRNRFVNHARNVWDRAVSLLPRIDQLWYKYIHMEEMLGNVAGARQVLERWMKWEPDHHGWSAYIKFELRYGEIARARAVFERYTMCIPTVKAWIRFAKFEVKQGEISRAREVYERAVEILGEDGQNEELFVAFAEFEERICKETERARAIYKYALDHVPKAQAESLYKKFVVFEKQHGDRAGIEDVVVGKRRFEYEEEVKRNPRNYDAWFDYVRLEESVGEAERVREVYERAIANVPPADEKRFWQRYIYLWINYALYEELEAGDMERTREVYRECLKLIPHGKFSFAKIWLLAAQFEIRQKRLSAARQILGHAIGVAPKDKIFKAYIEMELQLGNIDRCRMLYEKYLQWQPASCPAWAKFAELERSLGETERARAVYELAIGQPLLDTPELLWKAYIDFEIAEGESERTRQLYERLLERTKHVKVWMSYGQFEAQVAVEEEIKAEEEGREADELVLAEQSKDRVTRAREVYERAFEHMRTNAADQKEERVMLLEAWREMERAAGVNGDPGLVEKKMPRRVKRKRPITTEDGTPAGFEEYYDYIFPDEAANQPNLKILEAAYKWKRQKLTMGDEEEGQQGGGAETDEGESGAMAGGLDVHKNKYIEDWGTRRENLEKIFRFNRRTLSIAALAIVVLPVVVYRGTIAEFRKQEELEGRPQRKFILIPRSSRSSSLLYLVSPPLNHLLSLSMGFLDCLSPVALSTLTPLLPSLHAHFTLCVYSRRDFSSASPHSSEPPTETAASRGPLEDLAQRQRDYQAQVSSLRKAYAQEQQELRRAAMKAQQQRREAAASEKESHAEEKRAARAARAARAREEQESLRAAKVGRMSGEKRIWGMGGGGKKIMGGKGLWGGRGGVVLAGFVCCGVVRPREGQQQCREAAASEKESHAEEKRPRGPPGRRGRGRSRRVCEQQREEQEKL